jgi:hypothetical protein
VYVNVVALENVEAECAEDAGDEAERDEPAAKPDEEEAEEGAEGEARLMWMVRIMKGGS